MELLLSNFFKFINFEIRGHKPPFQSNSTNTHSRIPSNNPSIDTQNSSDNFVSPITHNINEQNIHLDLKSVKRNGQDLLNKDDKLNQNQSDGVNDVINAIPQNLLVHMARLPYYFERLIYHSVGICFDSLLFEITFMPIQAITSISHLLTQFTSYILNEIKYVIRKEIFKPLMLIFCFKKKNESTSPKHKRKDSHGQSKAFETVQSFDSFEEYSSNSYSSKRINSSPCLVTLTEICGCVRFLVLVTTIYIFSFIDTSRVYHNIKGQPLMKLYVIFNMLEICERLCRSFSRDIMDSLIRTTIKIFLNHFPEHNYNHHTNDNDTVDSKDKIKHTQPQTKQTTSKNKSKKAKPPNAKVTANDDSHIELKPSFSSSNDSNESTSPEDSSRLDIKNQDDCGFLTPKSPYFIPLESFVANQHMESILFSSRNYGENFNIYYKFVFLYFFVVFIVSFHSFLHLVRVLSLNIAINSPESTMFLLLITNNFSEIKSTVFKKYDSYSLFVIFASDAVERCYLFCDGLLVILKMLTSKRSLRSYITVLSWLVVIYVLEMFIDLFKHGYLIKFNRIKSETFEKYNSTLVVDTLLSRSVYNIDKLTLSKFDVPCKGSFSFSHISSRRLGFMSSPIVTLIVCSLPKLGVYLSVKTFTISVLIWLSLILIKISLSILLTAYSIEKKRDIYSLDKSFYKIGAL